MLRTMLRDSAPFGTKLFLIGFKPNPKKSLLKRDKKNYPYLRVGF